MPPLDPKWTRPNDWHLLFASKWSRSEHQNVLEARAIVNVARHLARSAASWRKHYLLFTDSLVCLGCYAIPVDAVHAIYDSFRADIFGFTFFSLFIASTVLLTFEQDDASEESAPE